MAAEIEVTTSGPVVVEALQNTTNINVEVPASGEVTVNTGAQQQNLWVTTENPGASGPGLWIQTGVNGDPEAVTLNLIYDDGL